MQAIRVSPTAAGPAAPPRRTTAPLLRGGTTVALLAVVAVCIAAARSASPVPFDDSVLTWFAGHRVAALNTPMDLVSTLFAPGPAIVIAAIVAALVAWRLRDWRPGVQILASAAITMITVLAVKFAVNRGRPPLDMQLGNETDASFPSGHIAGMVILGVATCYALWHVLSRAGKALAAVLVLVLIALVATSRLYLAAHWGTDVLAGLALAAAFSLWLPELLTRWLTTALPAHPCRR